MVVRVVGDLTGTQGIVDLHVRLVLAREEATRDLPEECIIDLREATEYGVGTVHMLACFMQWFRDHHPCSSLELLL